MVDHALEHPTRRPASRLFRALVALTLLASVLLLGRPASAEPVVSGPGGPFPVDSPFTELQVGAITGALGVTDVDAFEAPSTFDPVGSGYPDAAEVPSTWTARSLEYAGSIPANDAEGTEVLTYCIDLLTETQRGVTYERGEWNEANVRNLGYVAYILNHYYPSEPEPAGVADNVKSAAVQSAIWFFSDNLVLNPTDEPQLFALTSAIVTDAIENGPLTEPAQPTLSVSPDTAQAPSTGELVGPFTVTADGPSTLRAEGVEVFSDAAGTQPLAEGATVQPGAQLWARSTSTEASQGFSLQREETVRESTVYLYDGQTAGRETAQKLILAQDTSLAAVASVRITRFAAGGLEVTKTISGDGAGLQGEIQVLASCTPTDGSAVIERRLTIPAGTAAGSQSATFTGLPAGATCTITEPENGDNGRVTVTASSITPETLTIVEGQTSTVAATNDYALSYGGIEITKTISGAAAGLQGAIVVLATCTPPDGGAVIERQLEIPAATAAGSQSATFDGLLAGTECVVTEPSNGDNDQVRITASSLDPETVTVVEDETTPIAATNEFGPAVGSLQVTKIVDGPAAGEQDEIVLAIDCDDAAGTFDQEFVIPAGSLAGGYVRTVTDIPVGTTCEVTETASGVTETVVLATPTTITPGPVTIVESAVGEITATNTYRAQDVEEVIVDIDDEGFSDYGGYLPTTGAPSGPTWMLGLGLVLAGAAALVARRRSHRDR